jgi:hypothetical protein
MSELSISPYFPFRRIKIVKQVVAKTASKAFITVVPDKRTLYAIYADRK